MDTNKILDEVFKKEKADYLTVKKDRTKNVDDTTDEYIRVTSLLYCPLKVKYETEIEIPSYYKLPMYKGTAIHDWFEEKLVTYNENIEKRFDIEKPVSKSINIDNRKYTIAGRIDAIDIIDNVILELKNHGHYRIMKTNLDGWITEQQKIIKNILQNPPQHYLEQLLLYSWMVDIHRLQLILLTDIAVVDVKFELKIIPDEPIVLIGEKVKYYLYDNNGPIFLKKKHPDKNPIYTLNDFTKSIINRYKLCQKLEKPIWTQWECDYCYFCKIGHCNKCIQKVV